MRPAAAGGAATPESVRVTRPVAPPPDPEAAERRRAVFGYTGMIDVSARGEGRYLGLGIANYVKPTGRGPFETGLVRIGTSGKVSVYTGAVAMGQGFHTAMAQICAGTLGVDYQDITVVHGQTARIAHGIGAHASRATVMTASATNVAALKVREKALDVAAELMQAPVDKLDIVDGRVIRVDQPTGPSITLGEIAAGLWPTRKTIGGREPGLSAEGWFHSEHQTYP